MLFVYIMLSRLIFYKIWLGIFIKLLNRRFETSRVGDDVEYPLELCTQYMHIKTSMQYYTAECPPSIYYIYFIYQIPAYSDYRFGFAILFSIREIRYLFYIMYLLAYKNLIYFYKQCSVQNAKDQS